MVSSPSSLLLPSNPHLTAYHGFITLKDREFRFQIEWPGDCHQAGMEDFRCNSLATATLKVCKELAELLKDKEVVLKQLAQYSSLNDFLVDLKELCDPLIDDIENEIPCYIPRLIDELNSLGWHRIAELDQSLQTLSVEYMDSGYRKHVIQLRLPSDYPTSPPMCRADLPDTVTLKWTAESSLIDAVLQCQQAIESYQDLWNLLDDLDANTIQLSKPSTRASTTRRVNLGHSVAVHIRLSTTQPRDYPLQLQFFGPTSKTGPIKRLFLQNRSLWDPNLTTRHNLELILSLSLPRPTNNPPHVIQDEIQCPICTDYYHYENNEVPDISCENDRCTSVFHAACLKSYLLGTSLRISFKTAFGKCPGVACDGTIKLNIDDN